MEPDTSVVVAFQDLLLNIEPDYLLGQITSCKQTDIIR